MKVSTSEWINCQAEEEKNLKYAERKIVMGCFHVILCNYGGHEVTIPIPVYSYQEI